jgi:hypothetical protein
MRIAEKKEYRRVKARGWILGCAIVLAAGLSAANGRQRAAWTHYKNARWGFCVDYPAQWEAKELTDGSGVTLYPDRDADTSGGPYISVSGLPDQPDIDNANIVLDDSPPLNLDGNFTRALDSLREYDHASDIRVLAKRTLEFQGYDALRTSIRYRTAPKGRELADETFWINKEYIIFTATLLGPPAQVRKLESVYRDMVMHRFQLVCAAAR